MKAIATRPRLSDPQPAPAHHHESDVPLAALCAATSLGLLLDVVAPVTAALARRLDSSWYPVRSSSISSIPADRSSGCVATIVVSITSWMVVAHVLLTLQWWRPRYVGGGRRGSGDVRHRGRRSSVTVSHDATHLHALVQDLGTVRRSSGRCGVALWAVSLPFIDTVDIGDWGLITSLHSDLLRRLRDRHRRRRPGGHRCRHERAPGGTWRSPRSWLMIYGDARRTGRHDPVSVVVQARRRDPLARRDGAVASRRRHLQQLLGLLRAWGDAAWRDRHRSRRRMRRGRSSSPRR